MEGVGEDVGWVSLVRMIFRLKEFLDFLSKVSKHNIRTRKMGGEELIGGRQGGLADTGRFVQCKVKAVR